MVDDRDGGDRVRLGGEAQVHRAVEASILVATGAEPGDHTRASGAQVKREPFATPEVSRSPYVILRPAASSGPPLGPGPMYAPLDPDSREAHLKCAERASHRV